MLKDKASVVQDLSAIVGAQSVLTDEASLASGEGNNGQFQRAFGIKPDFLPIAIVKVKSTEEVSKVLKYCNENKVNVLAKTGASSGEGLLRLINDTSIYVDASDMNQMINLDVENMQATVGCGMPLARLEDAANAKGLTTGHCPQSQPLAQMGGLVATRSIGQYSTFYGGIEDMVCGLEAVLPNGNIVRIRNVPRRSSGPDMRHLFIGSEGALAFITEVTVKLFPYYPEAFWKGGYIMSDFVTGLKAIRDIISAGYKPSVVRLYDKSDYDHNFGGVEIGPTEAYMFFVCEGPARMTKAMGEGVDEISKKYGGRSVDTKAIDYWLEHKNDVCKIVGTEELRQRYRDTQTIYATTEISASWTDIKEIYDAVIKNVPPQIPGLAMLGGHVSHSYTNGTNIYFVYQLKVSDPKLAQKEHMALVYAICREVLKFETGGVCHHHGMGKDRVVFSKEEHGTSYQCLEMLKKGMDPNGIMNIGTLLPID